MGVPLGPALQTDIFPRGKREGREAREDLTVKEAYAPFTPSSLWLQRWESQRIKIHRLAYRIFIDF
jgi:hypothetical protein